MTPVPFFDRDLSRRAFLGGGLAVAGGLITAASLGGTAYAASAQKLAPLVLSSDLYVWISPNGSSWPSPVAGRAASRS